MKVYAALAISMTLALAAFVARPRIWHDPVPPNDPVGMARWVSEHPADWLTASVLTDSALDARIPQRFELWRASYDTAAKLAPLRPNPRAAFVRAGLFHWYELSPPDRKLLITELEPMLRDVRYFGDMYAALWMLTRDFALLRRANPGDANSLNNLRTLAATHGRFEDYRELREEIRRKLFAELQQHRGGSPADLIAVLPSTLDAADTPLVKAILQELHEHPLDVNTAPQGNSTLLLEFALDHNLEPLDGLQELAHSEKLVAPALRARLALRLGHPDLASRLALLAVPNSRDWSAYHRDRALYEARRGAVDAAEAQLLLADIAKSPQGLAVAAEVADITGRKELAARRRHDLATAFGELRDWEDLCSADLCRSANRWVYVAAPRTLTVRVTPVQSDEVPPYVEAFVDGVIVAEQPISSATTMNIPIATAGLHRVELRLVNRFTRNQAERRVRLS